MNRSVSEDFLDLDVSRTLYEDLEEFKESNDLEDQYEKDGIDSKLLNEDLKMNEALNKSEETPKSDFISLSNSSSLYEDLEVNRALVKSESKIYKRNPGQIKKKKFKAKKNECINIIQTRSMSARKSDNSLNLRPPTVQISSGTINFVHADIFIKIKYKKRKDKFEFSTIPIVGKNDF
ncbi:uncharacterized protein LOC106654415 [Trichogramma pretiosum]|uniref:uncharacterized protein LOC106654415 n=1 Tax=Trichogramma pretiosum TaxID=7493 RepID=UPI0006C99A15|nr:uncharacterized protein LOC106654415 [Trichogramma pretiosum]XP_014229750.1 uncharacterized protein LOC106654415 [Trichogramma pretiosum]